MRLFDGILVHTNQLNFGNEMSLCAGYQKILGLHFAYMHATAAVECSLHDCKMRSFATRYQMIFPANIYSNYFAPKWRCKQTLENRHLISYWIEKQTSASLRTLNRYTSADFAVDYLHSNLLSHSIISECPTNCTCRSAAAATSMNSTQMAELESSEFVFVVLCAKLHRFLREVSECWLSMIRICHARLQPPNIRKIISAQESQNYIQLNFKLYMGILYCQAFCAVFNILYTWALQAPYPFRSFCVHAAKKVVCNHDSASLEAAFFE